MKAVAAVLKEPNTPFVLEELDVAQPRPDEILVRIQAVGICHTDLVFASGAMGTNFPLVLGHEGAGEVVAIGEKITKVAPGDKVLLTFDSCGHCANCEAEAPAYCDSFTGLNFACARPDGTSPLSKDGQAVSGVFFGQSSFASLAVAHERNVVKAPSDADLSLLAPLGCGVQTGVGAVLRSLEARKGSALVVLGGGAVGLSAVLGGVLAGCDPIILIEPRPERRALGAELGAHHVIDPAAGDITEAVRAISPRGVDNIVDTSGVVKALEGALGMLAPKGALALIGVPGSLDAVLPVPIVGAITYGFTVKGVIEGDSDPDVFLPQLVEWTQSGQLPLEKIVRRYPFADINQAIADAHDGRCVKAVLILD
ncbi:NAD(P)-dependent alcohol dehydrogenase [Brevundimonas sp.]|uniref:NAD(P)-dependent alcohol dehydrogenase n=1 Tax=Brevundimonas sp. TaxID=1871086 RepID=UPI00289AF10C|nr:NAD(P)-dependent alcohol dehydrogenase [Brevundimonas sp.]